MNKLDKNAYVTIAQAIGSLQLSPSTIYRLMRKGTLETIKFGSSTRISAASIEALTDGGF